MKICPICKVKFQDTAEFCPKCCAQLEKLEEKPPEPKKIPRAFWFSLLGVFGFIIFIMIVAGFFYNL